MSLYTITKRLRAPKIAHLLVHTVRFLTEDALAHFLAGTKEILVVSYIVMVARGLGAVALYRTVITYHARRYLVQNNIPVRVGIIIL